jgi:ATP-binding cassette, subfamily B, bacterial
MKAPPPLAPPDPPRKTLRELIIVQRQADEEPEEQQRPLDWGLIRRMLSYTRPIARKRNALIGLTLLRALQLPALAWVVSAVIGGPISRHDVPALFWGVVGYLVLSLSTDGLFHFRQRYAQEIGEAVIHALRRQLFECVQRQPMAFFHRVKLGAIIGRMTSDITTLRVAIQDVFFVSIVQVGQMIFAAVVMLITDWVLFLVVAAMAPILWYLNRHFRTRLSHYSRATQESFSRVTANLAETVGGIRVTQGFVREQTNAGLFRQLIADHARYNIALARTSAVLVPMLELNSQFFISVLLLLGGWRTFAGEMAMADLITFFFLANMFFAPIQILGNMYHQALMAMAGAERVFRLIDRKPEWEDEPEAMELDDPRKAAGREKGERRKEKEKHEQAAPEATLSGITPSPFFFLPSPSLGASVEFRSVTFGYDPARPVLHEVSFAVEPGQTVALVGHTGSGKSSILNLVGKFYLPTAGEVLIDGRGIRTMTSASLHRQLGMVTQQNFLFSGTVLENIRLSRPEASDEDVQAVVAALGCSDILDALPRGLLTEVGERGGGISLGQRQLVCFARALLADPRLVLLDEATSAIDALTEARLQQALRVLLQGRTSFVVAHRLSTIREAHQVLVLAQGRIVERGTHQQLLSLKGHYKALHEQFVESRDGAGWGGREERGKPHFPS